jgi:hypothetical protein
MEKKNTIKKYPKSRNNYQCLTECLDANVQTLHPLYLTMVSGNVPFCAVKGYKKYNSVTEEYEVDNIDYCDTKNGDNYVQKKEENNNIMTPFIEFNYEQFLIINYDISNLEDGLDWCEKKNYVSLNTKIRIINCLINAFGNEIDIVEKRLCILFIEILKKKYMSDIYKKSYQYIEYKNEYVTFTNTNLDITEYSTERTNFLMETFLNENEIYKFMCQYFKNYKKNWNDIEDHFKNIINEFINYCVAKIKFTLEQG